MKLVVLGSVQSDRGDNHGLEAVSALHWDGVLDVDGADANADGPEGLL